MQCIVNIVLIQQHFSSTNTYVLWIRRQIRHASKPLRTGSLERKTDKFKRIKIVLYSKSSLNGTDMFLEAVTWTVMKPILPKVIWYKQELSCYSTFLVIKTSPNFQVKTQSTSNNEYWNKCELYIHLIKKQGDYSFPTLWFQFRVMVAGACPSNSGHKAGPARTGRPSIAGALPLTPTHSDRDRGDVPVPLTFAALGPGRKPGYPEEARADRGEDANSTQTVVPAWTDFSLNDSRTKQCSSRACCSWYRKRI